MAYKLILLVISGAIFLRSTFDTVGDHDLNQQILESSLMITMVVPELELQPEVDEALPIPPDEYRAIAKPDSYIASEGLATVQLNPDGEWLIITHDHWSVLDGDLGTVQISNSHGQLLAEFQLWQFKRLIRYRNGGTMVLTVPDEIAARLDSEQLISADRSLGNQKVAAGDEVSLVYRERDGNGIAVMQVEVEYLGLKQGLPILRVSNSAGLRVISGDSGGGIWLDGEFVANIWATIMVANTQTGERHSTNSSIAALISQDWTD